MPTSARLACSVAVAAALITGSAFAEPEAVKSTIGMNTDGSLLNPSNIDAVFQLDENNSTVTIKADDVKGGLYGVFANMAHDADQSTIRLPSTSSSPAVRLTKRQARTPAAR